MKTSIVNPAFDLRRRPHKLDHLSPTSVSSYLTCGLQWRLSHVDMVKPIKIDVAYALGTAFHNGLRPFWKGHTATFLEQWRKIKDNKNIDFDNSKLSWLDWYARGQKMTEAVARYMAGHFDPKSSQTELPYNLELPFIKVERRMDLITEVHDLPIIVGKQLTENVSGEILIDLKSAAQRYADESASYSQQLMTYMIPGREPKVKPIMAAYVVVTKSANPQVHLVGKRYAKDELKAQVQTIAQVADNIERGVFIKNAGKHCAWCTYRHMCSYRKDNWPELYRIPGDRSGANTTDGGPDSPRQEAGHSESGLDDKTR